MAWCKSGTRTPGPRNPGNRDLETGTPSKFKSGTQDHLNFNSETPGLP